MKVFDTIAAVSTPRGKGGVAVIRISGSDAVDFASQVFFPKNGKSLSDIEHGMAVYGEIKEKTANSALVTVDDGIATVFYAPRSFTGEDTVEISCHGGVLVTESVLGACLAAGCRQAERGEFTRRAFISGKMSLSDAEDLSALLEAKTGSQLMLSRGGLDGNLSGEITKIYVALREMLSSVYAKIDFPDEDLASLNEDEILEGIKKAESALKKLSETYRTGRAVRDGVKTVICGRTNAGKSSLYNRILGRDAAIVTDVEGTTRDILEQNASLGGITLLLCDTAGLRETEDVVENIGISRSREAIKGAELVFAVFDGSTSLTDEDRQLLGELSGREGVIAVLNKCDTCEDMSAVIREISEQLGTEVENIVKLSAKTGDGFEILENAVKALFGSDSIDLRHDAVVTNARQYGAVMRALESLESAAGGIENGLTVDLCGTDIEQAMSALGEIEGREVTEDIVSDIFSHFCVGK